MSDSQSELLRTMLTNVGSEDQRLISDERRRLLDDHCAEGPLLDQLCLLRVVMLRLSEGYARSLGEFEARLARRIGMRPGWRKSLAHKSSGEYESPMPCKGTPLSHSGTSPSFSPDGWCLQGTQRALFIKTKIS